MDDVVDIAVRISASPLVKCQIWGNAQDVLWMWEFGIDGWKWSRHTWLGSWHKSHCAFYYPVIGLCEIIFGNSWEIKVKNQRSFWVGKLGDSEQRLYSLKAFVVEGCRVRKNVNFFLPRRREDADFLYSLWLTGVRGKKAGRGDWRNSLLSSSTIPVMFRRRPSDTNFG